MRSRGEVEPATSEDLMIVAVVLAALALGVAGVTAVLARNAHERQTRRLDGLAERLGALERPAGVAQLDTGQRVGATAAERERALELINTELEQRLQTQFMVGDRIDTKATLLLGFVATATTFVLTQPYHNTWLVIALVAYAVAFAAGIATIALRTYSAVPKAEWLRRSYDSLVRAREVNVRRKLLGGLVGLRVEAVTRNSTVDKRKKGAWWVGLIALGIAVPLSVISLAAEDGNDDRATTCEFSGRIGTAAIRGSLVCRDRP